MESHPFLSDITRISNEDGDHMVLSENDNTSLVLDELEQSILLVARRLISRHYLLNTKILYSECARTMKDVDRGKIEASITNLISKKILLDGKAVTRETLMENMTRSALHRLIQTEPGIYLYKIMTKMQIDSRTALWHLHMLEEFALIRSIQIENNTIFFTSDADQKHDIVHYYLHKKNAPDIIKAIMKNPGTSFVQLLTIMGLPRSTLARKVKTLIDVGILIGDHDSSQLTSLTASKRYIDVLNESIGKKG